MKYLHTMIRVNDVDAALDFFVGKLGMIETRRREDEKGRYTLIFLVADQDLDQSKAERAPELELTYNWDNDAAYGGGRNFGHLAYTVKNIYETCQKLMDEELSSTGRRAMAAWLLCAHRTGFHWNCCKKARHLPQLNPGCLWKILAAGKPYIAPAKKFGGNSSTI